MRLSKLETDYSPKFDDFQGIWGGRRLGDSCSCFVIVFVGGWERIRVVDVLVTRDRGGLRKGRERVRTKP